jgi:hypothetical protein
MGLKNRSFPMAYRNSETHKHTGISYSDRSELSQGRKLCQQ